MSFFSLRHEHQRVVSLGNRRIAVRLVAPYSPKAFLQYPIGIKPAADALAFQHLGNAMSVQIRIGYLASNY
jgi:hypothetical protein